MLIPLVQAELIKDTIRKVIFSKEEEEKAIKIFLKKYGVVDEKNIEMWLKANNLTEEGLKNLALSNLRLKKYCQDNYSHQIEARFLKRKPELDIVVYSLIRVKDLYQATELYLRIKSEEENFGDLAKLYSEGVENKTRGIVGPIPLKSAHPQLIEKLQKIKPGEVQPPFKIKETFLVVRLESYEPAKLNSYTMEKMGEELFNSWIEAQSKEISETLLKKDIPKTITENQS